MFRKSMYFMLFVCLMAPIAMAAYPWNNQLEYQAGGADADWCNPANWTKEGDLNCPPTGPGPDFYCAVLPNQPGPRVGISCTSATASMLSMNPWDPTPWGGQDCNVTIQANAVDCNFGCAVQINSQVDYDSKMGGTTLRQIAIVNQYGGTVRCPNPGGQDFYGLTVGGGGSHFGGSYGVYNLYGGLADFLRVRVYYGQINIYGGTMQSTDTNFVFAQNHPENKINVNGGKFKVFGNYVNGGLDPCFPQLIKNGRMVAVRGGDLTAPVYNTTGPDAGYTTITGTVDFNLAWGPTPEANATGVHYRAPTNDANIGVLLSWNAGEPNVQAHDVYFGSSLALVNAATKASAEYKGTLWDANGDPHSRLIDDANFAGFRPNGVYYWRVDEEANNVDEAGVSTWTTYKGKVWRFQPQDGKAFNAKPVPGATSLSQPLQLSWSAGDYTNASMGHVVYFSTNSGDLNPSFARPTTLPRLRGPQTGTTYALTNLGTDFSIVPGTKYYWAIDEISGTTTYKGPEWSFTAAAYINIDDFEDYNSTDDVNANWPTGYTTCESLGGLTANAVRTFMWDGSGKYMQYGYRNASGGGYFSETKRNYNPVTSFTGSPVISPPLAALSLSYRGFESNPANPTHDRMYVALEDSTGNVGVAYNPDVNAQRQGTWTQWFISLNDVRNAGQPGLVNLAAVKNFFVGFGLRCNDYESGGGDGNVMFDNFRLYSQTCNPDYAHSHGVTADLDNDCDVDINDLDTFSNNWLAHAEDFYPTTTAPAAPILWFKFDESGTTNICVDSGTGDANAYEGTVVGWSSLNWKPGEGRDSNGCIYFTGADNYVDVNVSALGFMGDAIHDTAGGGGISFSVWIKADVTSPQMLNSWNGIFGTWNLGATTETLEIHCPSPQVPAQANFIKRDPNGGATAYAVLPYDHFGYKWNHFAFTKSADEMIIYCNGIKVGDINSIADDPDAYGPLFSKFVGAFRIATRGTNWGEWQGRMDDFKVFDYCLSQAEVYYLATDGSGHVFIPLVNTANIVSSGNPSTEIVDLKDLSGMCTQWHTWIGWP